MLYGNAIVIGTCCQSLTPALSHGAKHSSDFIRWKRIRKWRIMSLRMWFLLWLSYDPSGIHTIGCQISVMQPIPIKIKYVQAIRGFSLSWKCHTHTPIDFSFAQSFSFCSCECWLSVVWPDRKTWKNVWHSRPIPLLSYVWYEYYNKSTYLVYFMLMLQDSWKLFADTWLCNEKQSLQTGMIAKIVTFCAFGSMMLSLFIQKYI